MPYSTDSRGFSELERHVAATMEAADQVTELLRILAPATARLQELQATIAAMAEPQSGSNPTPLSDGRGEPHVAA